MLPDLNPPKNILKASLSKGLLVCLEPHVKVVGKGKASSVSLLNPCGDLPRSALTFPNLLGSIKVSLRSEDAVILASLCALFNSDTVAFFVPGSNPYILILPMYTSTVASSFS